MTTQVRTKVLQVDAQEPEPEAIARASEVLREGGLVVLPTDTVYGLVADPRRGDAVDRIYEVKRRSRDLPLVLLLHDMVQVETKRLKTFKNTNRLRESMIGTGIGVSGGALCGKAVFSESDIKRFRAKEPQTPLILIRPDTVPDDVGILLQVEGLLTARGGSTSHAAVTIPQLNKVGVVGFSPLKVYESQGFSTVDTRVIKAGDCVAIDGWSGAVYVGKHEIEG